MSLNKRTKITLEGGKPWGFRIMGGKNFGMPLKVMDVTSQKASSANLSKNDVIVEINGIPTVNMTNQEATQHIINSSNQLVLILNKAEDKSVNSNIPKDVKNVNNNNGKPVHVAPPKETTTKNVPVQVNPSVMQKTMETSHQLSTNISDNGLDNSKTKQSPSFRNILNEDSTPSGEKIVHISQPAVSAPVKYTNKEDEHKLFNGNNTVSSGSAEQISSKSNTQKDTTKCQSEQRNVGKDEQKKLIGEQKPAGLQIQKLYSNKSNESENFHICEECNQLITDSSYVSVLGKFYHKPHFNCSSCSTTLVGSSFYQNNSGGLVCRKCVGGENNTGGNCELCGMAITGSFLTAAGKLYHKDCFKCAKCKKYLGSVPFMIHNDKPHCEDCFSDEVGKLCSKCNCPIRPGQSYIEFDNEECHSECFKCALCKKVLASFKMLKGVAVCPSHY